MLILDELGYVSCSQPGGALLGQFWARVNRQRSSILGEPQEPSTR